MELSTNKFKNIKGQMSNMHHIMRKPAFCICENKGADQLCSNCAAHQRLRFCCIALPLLFKPLAIFCDYSLVCVGPETGFLALRLIMLLLYFLYK